MNKVLGARATKKFAKNRMALAASGVIGLYFMVFILVWVFGLLTREDASLRVLPNMWPGSFIQTPTLEQRFDASVWLAKEIETVFARDLTVLSDDQIETIFGEVALAERRLADLPLGELAVMAARLADVYEVVDDAYLLNEDEQDEFIGIQGDLADLVDEGGDADEIAELQAELELAIPRAAQAEEDYLAGLVSLEEALEEIMPMPTGWAGKVYAFRTFLGSDVVGRSISTRGFYSIKIAFQIGFVVATAAVFIGTLLGAAAGFYGKWVDATVMWFVSTLSSIPYIVLLAVISFMFAGHALFDNPQEHPELQLVKLYTAMGLTFWVGTARVVRGEVMKIKELEYIQAATALGLGKFHILIKHVIPNTAHLMFINFSLLFIGAIKNEVILSFLGLGVSGQPSWGTMISNASNDLSNYFFWEVGTASILMFGLVLAFNIVSDALQDAFDPKHV